MDGKCLRWASFLSRPQNTCKTRVEGNYIVLRGCRLWCYLYNIERLCCDRIWEISTRRTDSTDDGHASLSTGVTLTDHTAGSLVERSQTSTKMGRETILCEPVEKRESTCVVYKTEEDKWWEWKNDDTCRHLCQSTRDLSKSLGPTWGGVSHHTDIVAHITEIFW